MQRSSFLKEHAKVCSFFLYDTEFDKQRRIMYNSAVDMA